MRWAAPEILDRERRVSKESDVYSFGMVVIEVLAPTLTLLGRITHRSRRSLERGHSMMVRPLRRPLVFYLGTDQGDRRTRA